jgi:signal transduction histidine kinase
LTQVIVNLLANAIKFSPNNSTITVAYKEISHFVEVRIKDEGRGIPPEHMSAIFERFSQVQASDHSEKGGKGLGLAICKSIIEAHGGSIGVDSEAGKGATFWFTIPQPE